MKKQLSKQRLRHSSECCKCWKMWEVLSLLRYSRTRVYISTLSLLWRKFSNEKTRNSYSRHVIRLGRTGPHCISDIDQKSLVGTGQQVHQWRYSSCFSYCCSVGRDLRALAQGPHNIDQYLYKKEPLCKTKLTVLVLSRVSEFQIGLV